MIHTITCFWQRIGDYEHETVADYDEPGRYIPGSHRYSGRSRPARY